MNLEETDDRNELEDQRNWDVPLGISNYRWQTKFLNRLLFLQFSSTKLGSSTFESTAEFNYLGRN